MQGGVDLRRVVRGRGPHRRAQSRQREQSKTCNVLRLQSAPRPQRCVYVWSSELTALARSGDEPSKVIAHGEQVARFRRAGHILIEKGLAQAQRRALDWLRQRQELRASIPRERGQPAV